MGVIPIAPAGATPADIAAYLRPGTLSLPALPPLSLYIHFPWCVRKCPYCDFNSHEPEGGTIAIPEAAYLRALRADIETALPLIWGRRIISVFIGGGTPSLLSAAGVDALLSDVRALLVLEADCEITLEANPGTVETERFAAYRASGVNRLSLGIQSFDEEKLRALGRIHDRGQALAAVEVARRAFDNFNLDLMYGLPQQTIEEAQRDVEQALLLEPPHLSLYQLTLEPNTVFAKRPPPLPDDDVTASMHAWIEQRTGESGYRHYEVSAYARAGRESRHNLNYWGFGDYLGVGPGAHSQAVVSSSRRASGPLSQPGELPAARVARRVSRRGRRSGTCGPAVRVHAECHALARGRAGRVVHRTHGAAADDDAAPAGGGRAPGPDDGRSRQLAPNGPRSALPERFAGAISTARFLGIETVRPCAF